MSTVTASSAAATPPSAASHAKRLGGLPRPRRRAGPDDRHQEGTQQDFGYAFRQSVSARGSSCSWSWAWSSTPRSRSGPTSRRTCGGPACAPSPSGALSVVAANSLLRWSDSGELDTGRAGRAWPSRPLTPRRLDPLTQAFFGSVVPGIHWILLVARGGARPSPRSSAAAARSPGWQPGWPRSPASGASTPRPSVRSFLGGADHATGGLVALLGYLAIAAAAVTVARSSAQEADTRGFIDRVFSWRTGMPLVVVAGVLGLISLSRRGMVLPAQQQRPLPRPQLPLRRQRRQPRLRGLLHLGRAG